MPKTTDRKWTSTWTTITAHHCVKRYKRGIRCPNKKETRLNPIFKKDDESDRGNYYLLSLLSIPSKILESCLTDSIVDHVFTCNQLVTGFQWAYRKGPLYWLSISRANRDLETPTLSLAYYLLTSKKHLIAFLTKFSSINWSIITGSSGTYSTG